MRAALEDWMIFEGVSMLICWTAAGCGEDMHYVGMIWQVGGLALREVITSALKGVRNIFLNI